MHINVLRLHQVTAFCTLNLLTYILYMVLLVFSFDLCLAVLTFNKCIFTILDVVGKFIFFVYVAEVGAIEWTFQWLNWALICMFNQFLICNNFFIKCAIFISTLKLNFIEDFSNLSARLSKLRKTSTIWALSLRRFIWFGLAFLT